MAEIAGRHPELPIILARLAYQSLRIILPLLESFANVHIATGYRFTAQGCVKQLVDRVGADRVLFGTGFPESEAMMAVTQLMYADITDEDKATIGSRNFERLMEGIVK